MPESRFELKIGAPVSTGDGACGHVQQVILDPREHRLVALVVRRGRLFDQSVVVPLEQVADAADDEVRLKINCAQVAASPVFNPNEYVELGGGRQGHVVRLAEAVQTESPGSLHATQPMLTLRAGQSVACRDGHAGQVRLLLSGPQGQVRHFVLHQGRRRGRDVIVPVDRIQEVGPDNVVLTVERRALISLPEYHPDDVIAAEVKRALWDDDALREDDALDVTVREGVAILNGYVMTAGSKARVEQAARKAPGVLGIEDQLTSDQELVSAVAHKVAGAACAQGRTVYVHARNGIVYLGGEAGSAAERTAIEECAASVSQVRGIINRIRAPGVVVDGEERRVLQPGIGQAVYAADVRLGHVKHVVISPRNRRVTAMVVTGEFPDPEYPDTHTLPVLPPKRARQVVIPIGEVRHVTRGGVELRVSGAVAAECDDLDPVRFTKPDAAWQPPYPYSRADVLVDLHSLPSFVEAPPNGARSGARADEPTNVKDSLI